jgi:outer membrane protein assembly factor BamD
MRLRKITGLKLSALLLLALLLVTGCSLKNPEERPAEDLAKEGLQYYNLGKYYRARETFKVIMERFPFSRYSLLAELKSADCEYYQKNYPEALGLYEEFEKNHPTNEAMPYVLFQLGRSHYQQIDSIDRDTTQATEAIKAFERLLRTFPKSVYEEEAKSLIVKSRNFLADHELYVAKFYFNTKKYDEAKGRAEFLLTNYPETAPAEEAKKLLAEIAALPPEELHRKKGFFDLY